MERTVEQMLRSALHSGERNLALMEPTQQVTALGNRIGTFTSTHAMECTAAGIAVVGLGVAAYEAYSIIEKRLKQAHLEEEAFLDMIEKGVSTYFIAQNKKNRTKCDNYIHAFITELTQTDLVLLGYAGIHSKTLEHETKRGQVYAIMSTFAVSLNGYFEKVEDDLEGLAEARQRLTIFLDSLKILLNDINSTADVQGLLSQGSRFVKGTVQSLTEINATRFLVIALGNIVINLIAPTNPTTREPLSFMKSAECCELFHGLINKMRSSRSGSEFHKNVSSLKCRQAFDNFLLSLSEKVLALQIAYRLTAKEEPNLNEVSTNAHLLLRSLNFSLRELVYPSHAGKTNLKENIIDLATLVQSNPELVTNLVDHLKFKESLDYKSLGLNTPPKTAIDVLTLWSEASPKKRRLALSQLTQETDQQKQFRALLIMIDKHFITPIEKIDMDPACLLPPAEFSFNSVKKTFNLAIKKRTTSAARLYLMSFIAMELAVDSVIFSKKDDDLLSEKQQILVLIQKAVEDKAVYGFSLLNKFPIPEATKKALMDLMRARYHILPLLMQLDETFSYLQDNQWVINNEASRDFLVPRLQVLQTRLENLMNAVSLVVEASERAQGSHTGELLNILSSLNAPHPNMLKIPISQIASELQSAIQHSLRVLNDIRFDERMDKKEQAQIQFIKQTGCNDASLFPEQKANAFYRIMQPRGASVRGLLTAPAPSSAVSPSTTKPVVQALGGGAPSSAMPHTLSAGQTSSATITVPPVVAKASPPPSYAFLLKALTWLGRVSAALLMIGFCTLVLMAFGTHSIAVIAALSAPVASGIMIGGLVSAAAGGLGLVTAYYTPRLFKSGSASEVSSQSGAGIVAKV